MKEETQTPTAPPIVTETETNQVEQKLEVVHQGVPLPGEAQLDFGTADSASASLHPDLDKSRNEVPEIEHALYQSLGKNEDKQEQLQEKSDDQNESQYYNEPLVAQPKRGLTIGGATNNETTDPIESTENKDLYDDINDKMANGI